MSEKTLTSQPDEIPDGQTELAGLYSRAFGQFGTRALWNMKQLNDPTQADILATARQLRREGDLSARRLAERMEKAIHAHI